ncbi:MAG TPA: UDP-glucuronate 5-epimerase [Halieaceae bacterium]|nr:UDP-glucuronate 5-epimerase [Halieaceae bacterium]
MKVAVVTGSSGFIGSFVCHALLRLGWRVVGVDCMSNYYDVSLKEARESRLLANDRYLSIHDRVETPGLLLDVFEQERPDAVIHLAAQAGVRHSIENPRSYLESNIVGTFELLEAARVYPPVHMLLASTSSAYGANTFMPYSERVKADHQMSFYAATKKSTESMAHSYAHLYGLPITMFRFFTVYGPWGRPDMALFKFTKAVLNDAQIDVYNYGDMKRDFTYIDDLVEAITLLIDAVPARDLEGHYPSDSLSPVAPFRVVNIGNSDSVQLTDFIQAIEAATGKQAKRNLMPMQAGDVPATWADASLLMELTGYSPKTTITDGVKNFVDWYRDFYDV